jgi:hypothetical protein
VSDTPDEVACKRCGRLTPASEVDDSGWCAECRAAVIHRATIAAHAAVVATAVGLIIVLFALVRASPQFLVLWLVLVAGACFVLFKLVRRVAFEWYRARALRSER